MGSVQSQPADALDALHAHTLRELRQLWVVLMHSRPCGQVHHHEDLLPEAAFQLAFTSGRNGAIVKRVFDMIDTDRRGALTREEFALGLLPLASSSCSEGERTRFLFRCFNLDGAGGISREDLTIHTLLASARDGLDSDLALTVEQAEAIVATTFASIGCEGKQRIGWTEFQSLLGARPRLLQRCLLRLRINVNLSMAQRILASDTARWLEIEPCPDLEASRLSFLESFAPRTPVRTPGRRVRIDATPVTDMECDTDLHEDASWVEQPECTEPSNMESSSSNLDLAYRTPVARRYGDELKRQRSLGTWTANSLANLRKSYHEARQSVNDARYRHIEDLHEQRTLQVLIPS